MLMEAINLVELSATFPLMRPPVYRGLRTAKSVVTVVWVTILKFDWSNIQPLGPSWRSDRRWIRKSKT